MTTSIIQPGSITGGQYNATPLVLTDQQTAASQLDSAGNLKVVMAGTPSGTEDVNIKQINGGTTGSFGSGATGVDTLRAVLATDSPGVFAAGQAAMAASLPVAIASNQSSIPVAATLAAGSAIAGQVGIDQTTPGTTNGVNFTPTANAAAGIAPVVSSALETGHVIKNGAGNLYGLDVVTTGAAGYVLVFNSTTVPAAGAVTPIDFAWVPAFGAVGMTWNPPLKCATGISVAFSIATTPFTKTDSATAAFSGLAV